MSTKTACGPLRKVIEHRPDGTVVLECGHIIHRRSTRDQRRRCPSCPYNVAFARAALQGAGRVSS